MQRVSRITLISACICACICAWPETWGCHFHSSPWWWSWQSRSLHCIRIPASHRSQIKTNNSPTSINKTKNHSQDRSRETQCWLRHWQELPIPASQGAEMRTGDKKPLLAHMLCKQRVSSSGQCAEREPRKEREKQRERETGSSSGSSQLALGCFCMRSSNAIICINNKDLFADLRSLTAWTHAASWYSLSRVHETENWNAEFRNAESRFSQPLYHWFPYLYNGPLYQWFPYWYNGWLNLYSVFCILYSVFCLRGNGVILRKFKGWQRPRRASLRGFPGSSLSGTLLRVTGPLPSLVLRTEDM
jgi:hypothetical protein